MTVLQFFVDVDGEKSKLLRNVYSLTLRVFEVHMVTKDYCNKDKSYGNNT
jgi:hypothetical protein